MLLVVLAVLSRTKAYLTRGVTVTLTVTVTSATLLIVVAIQSETVLCQLSVTVVQAEQLQAGIVGMVLCGASNSWSNGELPRAVT